MPTDDSSTRYAVRILPIALEEIDAAAIRLAEIAGLDIEDEWRQGISHQIKELSQNPRRHPIIPEQAYFRREVRQTVYRRTPSGPAHRILFVISDTSPDGPLVRVFHVRHASAKPIGRKEAREREAGQ